MNKQNTNQNLHTTKYGVIYIHVFYAQQQHEVTYTYA